MFYLSLLLITPQVQAATSQHFLKHYCISKILHRNFQFQIFFRNAFFALRIIPLLLFLAMLAMLATALSLLAASAHTHTLIHLRCWSQVAGQLMRNWFCCMWHICSSVSYVTCLLSAASRTPSFSDKSRTSLDACCILLIVALHFERPLLQLI